MVVVTLISVNCIVCLIALYVINTVGTEASQTLKKNNQKFELRIGPQKILYQVTHIPPIMATIRKKLTGCGCKITHQIALYPKICMPLDTLIYCILNRC